MYVTEHFLVKKESFPLSVLQKKIIVIFSKMSWFSDQDPGDSPCNLCEVL